MNRPITQTERKFIVKNPKIHGGEPIIKGTRFPVRSIIFYVVKEGMLPEELSKEFPQLNLAAVYEALSYYYDNREEIDRLIEEHKEKRWQKKTIKLYLDEGGK